MKKKNVKKKIIVWFIAALTIILLIPYPFQYKDGGTVEYRAVIYSVFDYHCFGPDGLVTGIEIKVLGITIYDSTNF